MVLDGMWSLTASFVQFLQNFEQPLKNTITVLQTKHNRQSDRICTLLFSILFFCGRLRSGRVSKRRAKECFLRGPHRFPFAGFCGHVPGQPGGCRETCRAKKYPAVCRCHSRLSAGLLATFLLWATCGGRFCHSGRGLVDSGFRCYEGPAFSARRHFQRMLRTLP